MKIQKILIFGLLSIALLALLNGCKDETPPVETPVDPLDDRKYMDAIQSSDEEACNKIKNEELKKTCINTIQSEKILSEAINNLDLKKCNEIPLEDSKKYCIEKVNNTIQEIKEKEDNDKILYESIENLNPENCDKIKNDKNLLTLCKNNIYQDKALKENDVTLCELITDEFIKNGCLANFTTME